MSSRNRTCHHLVPSPRINMPLPAQLLRLAGLTGILMEAASAFDECDPEATWTAVEFAVWLDVEVQAAVRNRERGAA